ncbi:MAG: GNAT family N-acetyltransferase [Abitibacteriaceae bacterium]|nr:GNAT family N-acetyltransferase [Abditibacteriaceae bacterium]MBV9863974.1 GNAT family N-acetyltransferase [Abditibacteriaceae bacterium]
MSVVPLKFSVVQVSHTTLDRLAVLWREDWLAAHPGDLVGADAVVADLERSLLHHDFLQSDSFWLFAAEWQEQFVGYVTAARIPKADGRLCFLYVDELFVLKPYRRQGVATALLQAVLELARTLSAQGVRLLVEPDNQAARALYQSLGFHQSTLIFCQHSLS